MSTTTLSSPAEQTAKSTASTILKSCSIKEFMLEEGYPQLVPTIRTNENGYPYITFITGKVAQNGKRIAENIYFSSTIGKADVHKLGDEVGAQFFKENGYQLIYVTYSDGRPDRWKISAKGEGSWKGADHFAE